MKEVKKEVEEPKVETPEDLEDNNEEVEKMLKKIVEEKGSENLTELKKELNTWLTEQKELMEKKAGLYAPEVKDKRAETNNKFKATCLALVSKDDTLMKDMTTDASGTPYAGYTVDSELSAEIRHLITEYGVARREMSTIPLTKGEYKPNTLVTDVSTFWVDEGGVIKSTQVVLGQESLKLKKLGAIVALTRELIEDGEVDLFAFIAQRLAEGFAKAEDEAFFLGAGSEDANNGGFTGVLNNTNVNIYTTSNTSILNLTAEDLLGMMDITPSDAKKNAKFLMHRTINSLLRKLKTTDGIYVWQAPTVGGPATAWGYPILNPEAFPSTDDDDDDTPFILFGDLRKACILGYKGGIDADMFDAGSVRNTADGADLNLITTDRKAMRWIERVGYVTVLPKAVTVLKTKETSE